MTGKKLIMKMKRKIPMIAPKIDRLIVCVAILCLTVIQLGAFHYGIDGTFRAFITGGIFLLAGLVIDPKKIFKN